MRGARVTNASGRESSRRFFKRRQRYGPRTGSFVRYRPISSIDGSRSLDRSDRKVIINALNSGAQVFMADFEDATSPTWRNVVEGQANLIDAVRRTITFVDQESGKRYALALRTACLMVRPLGLVSSLSCSRAVYSSMEKIEGGGGRWYAEKTEARYPSPLSPVKGGQFLAMDVATGRVLWWHETHPTTTSAALTTGGGLAIIGDGDRYLYIHDAGTGAVLYRTRLPAAARGFPVTYAVRGRQYLAVPTQGRLENGLFVFALPEQRPGAAR